MRKKHTPKKNSRTHANANGNWGKPIFSLCKFDITQCGNSVVIGFFFSHIYSKQTSMHTIGVMYMLYDMVVDIHFALENLPFFSSVLALDLNECEQVEQHKI